MLSLREFLYQTRERLSKAGVAEPRLEAEIILSDTMGVPRHRLYAFQDDDLLDPILKRLESIVWRRVKREPLAYILEHREFYGIDLQVGPEVMIPRQETEELIERAMLVCMEKSDDTQEGLVVVDVGTGSGGIAINLAIHLPAFLVYATDISSEALNIARSNILKYGVEERIRVVQGDLLEPINDPVDVIVANLPYICTNKIQGLEPELQWEPFVALNGGTDGLDVMKKLMNQAVCKLSNNGVILMEIDPGQGDSLIRLSCDLFPDASVSIEEDLFGNDRIFVLKN